MRIKQARHHLRVPKDRRNRHDVHAPLEERRSEIVPAQVEVEGDPGLLPHLQDRPPE